MFLPSMRRSAGSLLPEMAAAVGRRSMVQVRAPLELPAGTRSGQRTMQGTLMPPSSVRPFRPRRGRLLPCFSRADPLSEVKRTRVCLSIP